MDRPVLHGEKPARHELSGHVGRIPVRNLWLLMLYASELFRQLACENKSIEENPDDIPDLVAELLAHAVEKRIKRNLTVGYRPRQAVLGRMRGHVDLLHTESRQLLARGKVACRFEELTVSTPRNRLIRAALDAIARVVRRKALAHRCRALAGSLRQLGVSGEKPARAEVSVDRFARHDADDRFMVAAAHLAFDLALPTEETGKKALALPDREEGWVRRLYERAVGGFYDVSLIPHGWRVFRGKALNWPVEWKSAGIDAILPSMKADVILDQVSEGRRIVIDTKFTSILTRGWFRNETLRSGYLYQIYTYLRSQEKDIEDPLAQKASGLLLHPSIGEMIDETVMIQGHAIRFATVDLGAPAPEIRRQLMRMVDTPGGFLN